MSNIVIGITGGIGSGKSTVSEILEDNGCKVLRSDDIAKQIMNDDLIVSTNIKNQFGIDCYTEGKLNTKVLAKKVFNHSEKINKLNSIWKDKTTSIPVKRALPQKQHNLFVSSF